MIVDATIIGIERRALEIFANRNAKRQVYIHHEPMMLCVGLNDPKCEFQVKQPRAGLAQDFLPGHGRTWRVYAVDAHIEDMSPSGGVYEKRPNDPDRCIDDSRRTARIRHRNFASLSTTRKRRSVGEGRLFQQHVGRLT